MVNLTKLKFSLSEENSFDGQTFKKKISLQLNSDNGVGVSTSYFELIARLSTNEFSVISAL